VSIQVGMRVAVFAERSHDGVVEKVDEIGIQLVVSKSDGLHVPKISHFFIPWTSIWDIEILEQAEGAEQ
jgi:hypothetical protein